MATGLRNGLSKSVFYLSHALAQQRAEDPWKATPIFGKSLGKRDWCRHSFQRTWHKWEVKISLLSQDFEKGAVGSNWWCGGERSDRSNPTKDSKTVETSP